MPNFVHAPCVESARGDEANAGYSEQTWEVSARISTKMINMPFVTCELTSIQKPRRSLIEGSRIGKAATLSVCVMQVDNLSQEKNDGCAPENCDTILVNLDDQLRMQLANAEAIDRSDDSHSYFV